MVIVVVFILGLIFLPSLLVGFVLKYYNNHVAYLGGSGAELARYLLDEADLKHVIVEKSETMNAYDPTARKVMLEEKFHDTRSISALAVAAHEVSHAVQHAREEKLFQLRIDLIVKTEPFQTAGLILISIATVVFIGVKSPLFLFALGGLGLILMICRLLVHVVTLPVEWDASFGKALPALERGEILAGKDLIAAKRVLTACALTYVSAALIQLLYIFRAIK